MSRTELDPVAPPAARKGRPWVSLLFFVAGVGALAWILQYQGGFSTIGSIIERVGPYWPVLLVPFAINASLMMLSYRAGLPGGGRAVPWSVMIHTQRSGAVLESLLPLGNYGGNIAKIALLRHWYTSEQIVAAGAWAALTMGLLHALGAAGPIYLAIAGLTPAPGGALWLGLLTLAMAVPAAAILLLVRYGLSEKVARLLTRIRLAYVQARKTRILDWASGVDTSMAEALTTRRGDFLLQLGYKALAQIVRIVEIWIAIELLHLPGGLVAAILYNALHRVSSLVWSFVPGQVGALEATSMVGFDLLGFTPEAGLELALVLRFRYIVNMALSATALATAPRVLRKYPPRA